MSTRRGRAAREFFADMRARDPELQAEYDRLGPRYEVIKALIEARQRAKLTQRELAERMGVNQSVVGRLEGGQHDPRLDTIVRAASALDCDIEVRFKRRRRAVEGVVQTT